MSLAYPARTYSGNTSTIIILASRFYLYFLGDRKLFRGGTRTNIKTIIFPIYSFISGITKSRRGLGPSLESLGTSIYPGPTLTCNLVL